MNRSLRLRQDLHASIRADVAERTARHQAEVAKLRTVGAALDANAPLILLAHGDSWFDYPLTGNGLPLCQTDVIAQLQTLGSPSPLILNVSHFGDAASQEMALPKQQRLIAALADPANWGPSGKPDAILFSGGGDDIAGDQFCIFLDANTPGSTGLDQQRFNDALGMVEASFLDLFAFRDRHASGAPILAHDYDFPIPNGVHPLCAGPWLQPSLVYMGWTEVTDGERIVKMALEGFSQRLARLADAPANGFHLVHTQGTLRAAEWANELHPNVVGFTRLAERYVAALRAMFGGRI
jgi:hypothetical protein